MADGDLMRAADEAEAAVIDCEHHWASSHEPGHIVYWVRTCTLCHRVDWADLDREVRNAVNELLVGSTATCENRNG